jgi:uncharacterized protein YecE (DUF72 family)
LLEPKATTQRFLKDIKYLNAKLGPILFQLPPGWKVNISRLSDFIKALPRKLRYVFEFRNATWYTNDVYALLQKYNCGFCVYELARHTSPVEITADFVYLRLHGPGDKYQGSYTKPQLKKWARSCEQWTLKEFDVFAYFDNDQLVYATHNALELKKY